MILSDGTIKDSVLTGEIDVEPLPDRNQYQPASLDLRLGDGYYDATTDTEYEDVDEIVVRPGSFYLCHTKESVSIPNDIASQVTGRSSIGREGVIVHATAGWLDPGWSGSITLEVANFSNKPVTLTADERVCQLVFWVLNKPCEVPYGDEERDSKYQGQSGPTKSRR